jgi:hypothetical protein
MVLPSVLAAPWSALVRPPRAGLVKPSYLNSRTSEPGAAGDAQYQVLAHVRVERAASRRLARPDVAEAAAGAHLEVEVDLLEALAAGIERDSMSAYHVREGEHGC